MPTEKVRRRIFIKDSHPELPIDPDAVRPGEYRWPPHFRLSFVTAVFVGGCLGTLCRYWISLELPTSANTWPMATFLTNLLGAFLLGFLLEGLTRTGPDTGARRIVRLAVGTGFMGAFTTYSTLAVETVLLYQHAFPLAAGYIGASAIGGILLSAAGIQIAAAHHKHKKAAK